LIGTDGDGRHLTSNELPAEHRSTTVVLGVVHTITTPPAGYLRCGPDAVGTIEADTTQRPNAYELATVDGEHPRLSRALCLHRVDRGFTVVQKYNKIAIGYRRHPFLHSGRSYVFADIPLFEEDRDALPSSAPCSSWRGRTRQRSRTPTSSAQRHTRATT
jgi:hypothetical protein